MITTRHPALAGGLGAVVTAVLPRAAGAQAAGPDRPLEIVARARGQRLHRAGCQRQAGRP